MACPHCRAPVPEGSRFCPACGQPVHARGDERRIATVLFADLVGFTTMSERLDPEQVKNLVDGCLARLVADITRFGGQVDKILGDAVVALFGAPVAHEDDAERAVRAALQMQDTLVEHATLTGFAAQLRIGINTGEVLVGASRAGGDYTAVGDVVNVANRLQTAARPGQVLVGPGTHAATRDVIGYEPAGLLQAKGRDEPVEAWTAVEALGPPGSRRRRPTAPLVGRDAELGLLGHALDTAARRRQAQLLLLLGEAGVGKSRLAEEVAFRAAGEWGGRVLDGRCVPYGEANAWWPVAEAIREACGIEPGDSPSVAARTCRAAVVAALAGHDGTDADRVVAGLLRLMNLDPSSEDLDPTRAREDAVRSATTFLQALAHERPLMIVLSELHWADQVVLDLIDRLLETVRNLPVVVLATARPELVERWSPKPGRHNLVSLTIEPLDREAAAALLASLLESPPPADVRDLLLERSGGNPFFLEELVSLLNEAGMLVPPASGRLRRREGSFELPATLRGLVSARLDALGARERAILEDAAVAGRTAPVDALVALAESRAEQGAAEVLDGLAAKDLLVLERGACHFRSELVREVAYETLTKAARARRHAALGLWLADRSSAHGGESADLQPVAHHLGTAASLTLELGGAVEGVPADIKERAVQAIEKAALRAEARGTSRTAGRLYDQAVHLAGDKPSPDRRRLLLGRARSRAAVHEELPGARADALAVQAEAEDEDDRLALARALTTLGTVEQHEGALAESSATLGRAVQLCRDAGDRRALAEALRAWGMTSLFLGDADTAEAALSEALDTSVALGDRQGEAWALQYLAWIAAFNRGDPDAADVWLDRSIRTFTAIGDWGGLSWSLGVQAWVRFTQGRLQEAEELARLILDEKGESGDRWAEAMIVLLLANVSLWQGRTVEALDLAKQAGEKFAAMDDRLGEIRSLGPLTRSLAFLGRVDAAWAAVDEMKARADEAGDFMMKGIEVTTAAGLAVHLGEAARITQELEGVSTKGLPVAGVEVGALNGLAHLLHGDPEAAISHLEPIYRSAMSEGSRAFTGSSLALAHAAAGRPDGVRAVASEIEGMGTYLDRTTLAIAEGLAAARGGQAAEAGAALARAQALTEATDDRLNAALVRLAQGHAQVALGRPGGDEALAEARSDLAALGAGGTAWDRAQALAAGHQAATSGTASSARRS